MYRKLSSDACTATVREAAESCLAAGVYPTRKALREHGARGDWATIGCSFRNLVETERIVIPPAMAVARNRAHHRALGTEPPVRCPKPRDPNPSPCAAELRDYRAAWRRITATPKPRPLAPE